MTAPSKSIDRTDRNATIVRLYATMTAPEIAEKLNLTKNTVKSVLRNNSRRGRGLPPLSPRVPHSLRLLESIDEAEHLAFCKQSAASSDALLDLLKAHHTIGQCEHVIRPGSAPKRMVGVMHGSIMGSGAAQCVDDRWGA